MADTFTGHASLIAFAANKAMCYIMNTDATAVIKIHKIQVRNNSVTVVTGVICQLELRKYSTALTFTGNAATSPVPHLSTNTALPAGVTFGSATTIATGTLVGTLNRMWWSSDEPTVTVSLSDEIQCIAPFTTLYESIPHADVQPIVLRQNQAIAIFNTTGSAGSLDTTVTFTRE